MKTMVLKLTIETEKSKRKALKVIAAVKGVDSVAVDMEKQKMTVIGEADPVNVTSRLRKSDLQKMVLKLTIENEKRKRKALKVIAEVEGVDSVAVDMEEKKDDYNWGSRPCECYMKAQEIRFWLCRITECRTYQGGEN
ncbi:uncharacterized protein LOC131859591 [Cryptomeria japonica]|uniref:uncharacterized protein LOC131859591 n=1 Tax=Cryptomeria japonica TaxID=3369 RepID=UPI0027DA8CC6|nr:uncharacterized protein LOC131859591 [Cryptomeria japonica]